MLTINNYLHDNACSKYNFCLFIAENNDEATSIYDPTENTNSESDCSENSIHSMFNNSGFFGG